MKRNRKIIAGASALLLAVGMGVAAVGTTSAYFSDTNTGGSISADLGSILVSVDGSETSTPVLTMGKLQPGAAATATFTVQNVGANVQDVYLQFPNTAEVEQVNELISSGAIQLTFTSGGTVVYDSAFDGALPSELQVVNNLAAGASTPVVVSMTLSPTWDEQGGALVYGFDGELVLHYNVVATQDGVSPSA